MNILCCSQGSCSQKWFQVSISGYARLLHSNTSNTHTEQSHVVYQEVLDAVADLKETIMGLLHSLKNKHL